MKYYLLDYENVNTAGLDGVTEIPSDSRIILFYTRNSNKIDLGVVNLLRDMEAELSIVEVHHGKQALDIQLASYLGYLIGTEPEDTEYYIISKDKGYRNVQSFWPDRRIVLCRNLFADSEIVDEPKEEKKPASRSRGGRKSTNAKASKATKEPEVKAEPKPEAEPEPKEEPKEEKKPNAFAEAAAIAKAVVEAKKARNEADKKEADKKETEQKEPEKKKATRKKTAKKESEKKAEQKETEKKAAKKEPAKKETEKKAADKPAKSKQRISDVRAEVNNEIQKRLSKEGIPGDVVNSTASFVSKNVGKAGYKQTVYRGIIKENGQKKGLEIYRLIKDIF